MVCFKVPKIRLTVQVVSLYAMDDHRYSKQLQSSRHRFHPKKKIHRCCVPQCLNKKTIFNNLHHVPTNKKRLAKWCDAVKTQLSPHMKVCSAHFLKTDYIPSGFASEKPNLKRTAVPSKLLPGQEEELSSSTKPPDHETRIRILADLETISDDMKATQEEAQQLELDAKQILDTVLSNHGFFDEVHCKIDDISRFAGNLGPFTLFPDLQKQLFTALEKYYIKVCSPNIIFSSVLTEVLLQSLMKIKSWDYNDAVVYLRQTSLKLQIV